MNTDISSLSSSISSPLSSIAPEQIEAWLDGELPADEAAILDRLVLEDTSLQERRRAHQALHSLIAAQIPAEPELPYADFFMHQLERRIEEEQHAAKQEASTQAASTSQTSKRPWMNWLPWALSASCAAALALVVSLPNSNSTSEGEGNKLVELGSEAPALLSAYSPRAEIRTVATKNAPVVVVLEGLPEYEGEVRGVGLRVSEAEASHPQQKKWSVASQSAHRAFY